MKNKFNRSLSFILSLCMIFTVLAGPVTAVSADSKLSDASFVAECVNKESSNVALKKPVFAKRSDGTDTTTSDSRPLSMAVDGIIGTDSADLNYASFGNEVTPQQSSFLQINLGKSYSLSELKMWRYWNDSRIYNATVIVLSNDADFSTKTIVYNSDAKNVHGLGAGTDVAYAETSGGKSISVKQPVLTQYIRIYMYGNSINTPNHIVEFQAMAGLPSKSTALTNAETALNIPALATEGNVTHPDVVVNKNEWNGYKYWMGFTPNKTGTSFFENPSIVASNNGVDWVVPAGLTNPVQPRFDSATQNENEHNCDTDLVYDKKNDRMILYWEWAKDKGDKQSEIRYRVSYDGINWGVPKADKREVTTGPQAYGVAIRTAGSRYSDLSPTVVYDSFREVYFMWANDAGDIGYSNTNNRVWARWSKDGLTNWSDKQNVTNFVGKNELDAQLSPWHQDIEYIEEFKEFWAVQQAFPSDATPDDSSLRFARSKDGINWVPVSNNALLRGGKAGKWDDSQIYRSTFSYEPADSGTLGEGTIHVWYAALGDNNTKWHIGYTSKSYIEVMKTLLENNNYSEPAMVEATALTLNAKSSKLKIGNKTSVVSKITPANASDGIVKYTSSKPEIATVDMFGNVVGVIEGVTTITATLANKVKGSVDIAVVNETPMRMTVDNEHPLILHQLTREVYHNYKDPITGIEPPIYGGQTIPKVWDIIPESQKPYSAIIIHPGGSVNSSDAHYYSFLNEQMKVANDNKIPFFINVGCSFTTSYLPNEKLIEYFEKYEYFLGATYSEIHSRGVAKDKIVHKDISDKLQIASEYGGFFLLSEINDEGDAMERILNDPVFYNVAKTCRDNFICLTKTTSAWTTVGYNSFESVAYGSWLSDLSGNWGTLIDSWMWFIENQWKLYEGTKTIMGGPEECRGAFAFPELLYPQRMIQEAMSGATVFLFEHPFNSESIRNQLTPVYTEAISKAVDYMLEERIPKREEMLSKTKIAYDSKQGTLNDFAVRNGSKWSLVGTLYGDSKNISSERSGWSMLTSTSGRYGIVPSIPKLIADDFFAKNKDIMRIDANMLKTDQRMNSAVKVKALFNQNYPETYKGNGYAYKLDDTWFTYNNSWEKKGKQSVTLPIKNNNKVSVEYDNFTYLLMKEQKNGLLEVNLNNFMVDKDDIWEGYVPWNERTPQKPATTHWDADNDDLWIQYLLNEYLPDKTRRDNQYRTTTITLNNQIQKPTVTIKSGMYDTYRKSNQFDEPIITYDAKTKTATITLKSNGWVNFTITTFVETNKGDLASIIDYANNQKNTNSEYKYVVPAVKKAFEAALAEAISVNSNLHTTQSETDEAYNKLLSLIQMLGYTGNTNGLKAVLATAPKDLSSYTAQTRKALEDAVKDAQAVLLNENSLQAEIDTVKDKLSLAINELKTPGESISQTGGGNSIPGSSVPSSSTATDTNNTGLKIEVGTGVTNVTNPVLTANELPDWSATAKEFTAAAKDFSLVKTFMINLYDSTTKVAKVEGGKIKVEIPFAGTEGKEYVVLRYNDDKTITQLKATYKDGKLAFETDHFSTYAIAVKADAKTNKAPATKIPATNPSKKPTTPPKTGDTSPITAVVLLAAIAGGVVLTRKKLCK